MLQRILIMAALLLPTGTVLAQTSLLTPAALGAEAPLLGLRADRTSYQLNVGATFAGRYGSATYVSPTVAYRLTPRFTTFGGMTFLRAMPGAALAPANPTAELPTPGLAATNHYLLYGGGSYAVSPRLALTGSAWKDLTPMATVNPYAGFTNASQGMSVRADYRLTENMTVSGGVRFSQGNPYGPSYSPLFSPLAY